MKLTTRKLNLYLLFKLPSAYLCGVRATCISDTSCEVKVKHRWINQNPFKSMFWAVQGMAAELTTGALVMSKIQDSNQRVSMLVASNTAKFYKKATGKITFTCLDGARIDDVVQKVLKSDEGQTIWLQAKGHNKDGIEVCEFNFEWTLKLKS